MNFETNEELKELARAQLIITDTKEEWLAYIEGVTDVMYAMGVGSMDDTHQILIQMFNQHAISSEKIR